MKLVFHYQKPKLFLLSLAEGTSGYWWYLLAYQRICLPPDSLRITTTCHIHFKAHISILVLPTSLTLPPALWLTYPQLPILLITLLFLLLCSCSVPDALMDRSNLLATFSLLSPSVLDPSRCSWLFFFSLR